MKKEFNALVVFCGLFVGGTVTAQAQGSFNFLTFNPYPNLGTVTYGGHPLGMDFTGQIYGGLADSDPVTWTYLGNPSGFLENNGSGTGVINGGKQLVTGIRSATVVDIVLRVWDSRSGDYETALLVGLSGESEIFTVTLGGGTPPLADPNVNTFGNFEVFGMPPPTIPEPSVLLLGIVGAGLLWCGRKKLA